MFKKYRIRIKYIKSNKNIKPMHLIILSCTFIFILSGFAFLASSLNINAMINYIIPSNKLDTSSNLGFRNSTYLTKIKTITFNNTINIPGTVVASWDVSDSNDESVMAYIVKNSSDNTKYDLYIEANSEIKANENSSSLFSGMTSLTTINNLNLLNTSSVTNMSNMFYNCNKLTILNLSSFDTSNVTNMNNMIKYVSCTIKIPPKTGSINNTTTKFYGKTTSTYVTGTFTLPTAPVSFSTDSWDTIATAAREGNTDNYHVGDTKCIHVNGLSTQVSNGCNGDFLVRIANMSTPLECSNSDFSQTACGFVIEFVEILDECTYNSPGTYGGVEYEYGYNYGGWPASEMREYMSGELLDKFPDDVKNVMLTTKAISGHGSGDIGTGPEGNFLSYDKLYLLAPFEVWPTNSSFEKYGKYDTALNYTRQLDYYQSINLSESNFSGATKKRQNGYSAFWPLRSARSDSDVEFFEIFSNGHLTDTEPYLYSDISPAFRIA